MAAKRPELQYKKILIKQLRFDFCHFYGTEYCYIVSQFVRRASALFDIGFLYIINNNIIGGYGKPNNY